MSEYNGLYKMLCQAPDDSVSDVRECVLVLTSFQKIFCFSRVSGLALFHELCFSRFSGLALFHELCAVTVEVV